MVVLVPAAVIDDPPSHQLGLSLQEEQNLRMYAADIIAKAGIQCRLPHSTICTAQSLMHRFYFRVPLQHYDVRKVALCSLFLGSKLDEHQRKFADLMQAVFTSLRNDGWRFQNTEEVTKDIVHLERRMLQELGFFVGELLEHPHRFVLQYVHTLGGSQEIAQRAWAFLNDSFRTTVPCCYQPHEIATASVWWAARKCDIRLPLNWWLNLETDIEDIHAIAKIVGRLYKMDRPAQFQDVVIPGLVRPATSPSSPSCDEDLEEAVKKLIRPSGILDSTAKRTKLEG
eukprot:GEMP01083644.1.p1 GENE.GEMP01083644.1~~GEMP01083644.1.p1  ORF type:complete len:284 (+),score=63.94 GEMP01083644.1:149-1000(+)